MTAPQRPLGLKAIIGYKFAKAPVMIALGLVLVLSPDRALRVSHHLTAQLSESGVLGWRIARWLEPYLTPKAEHRAAVVAWLDGATTLTEAVLLLAGHAWGEWLVVAGLAALLPIEAMSLIRRPRIGRAVVLLVNAAVVAYLVRRRLKHDPTGLRDVVPSGEVNPRA